MLTDSINGLAQPTGFDWLYVAAREVGTGMKEGLGTSEDRSLRTEASGQGGAEVLGSQRKAGCAPGPALGCPQVSSGLSGSCHWLLQAWKVRLPAAQPSRGLVLEWGHPSTFSSQAPFLGTREPSDLGWAGLGSAGVDFGSAVGFPEQSYGTGRVAKRQLNLPRGRGSRGVLVPERRPNPEQANP